MTEADRRLPFGRAPRVDGLVEPLIAALAGRGWRTARWLGAQLDADDRAIREAANQSQGRVISGQRGYHLTREASTQDVLHAAAWLKHQGETMIKRSAQIHAAMHRCETQV